MGKAFAKRIMILIITVAAGAFCLLPRLFVFGEGESTQSSQEAKSAMVTSDEGITFITSFEGLRLTAYKAVETEVYWTIGYGHYGPDVTEGMTITAEEATELFREDIRTFENYVNTFVDKNALTITQKQFDALVSFSYNVGTKWMTSSTIRTYLLNGIANYTNDQIFAAFGMWNTSGGKVLPGLTRRRKAEATLFLGGPIGVYEVTTADSLNVRSGAGTGYEIAADPLTKGEKVTISEVSSNNWGLCHLGWICLDYCQFCEPIAIIGSITNTEEGVKVSWSKDPDAAAYNIMRKVGDGDAELVATVTGTQWTDTNVKSSITYIYYINSVNEAGAITVENPEMTGSQITFYAAPVLTSAVNTAEGVRVKWKSSDGAVKYRVYRMEPGGTYKKLQDTTQLKWMDQTAVSGKTYLYTVAAYGDDGIRSGYHKAGLTALYYTAPTGVAAKVTAKGVKLSWTAVQGAVRYRVYRKSSGEWSVLGDARKSSYTDTTVVSGTTYKYRVTCIDSEEANYASTYSSNASMTYLKTTTVTVAKTSYGVKVKWKNVSGAVSYKVCRKTASGKWKKLAIVTNAKNYKDTTAQTGVTYSYKVRAYNGKYYSVYSEAAEITR